MVTQVIPTGLFAPRASDRRWSRHDATHLLRRAQFGASRAEIDRATADGLDKTLDRLLTSQPENEEFRLTESLLRRAAHDTGSAASLRAWWLHRMFYTANPLFEKLALFWHNHFATSIAKVNSVPHMAAQNDLCRTEALGSFRRLLHGMTKDVAMLIWLDGNANRRRHANENFAREVMELFSLGEGNYTEDDIKQAARAFTGWHVRDEQFWFNRRQHDFGPKTVFGRTANHDGGDIIDLCLAQSACPRFLAHKLLRAFVLDQPEKEHVAALAARIRARDFAMGAVLRELLASDFFYSETARAGLIKGPVELVLGALRALEARPNLQAVGRVAAQLGQDLFAPPTVKGWEGGRLWITSATLLQRNNFITALLDGQLGHLGAPATRTWGSAPAAVSFYTDLLLASDPSPVERARLVAYPKQAQGDEAARTRGLLHLIMTLPEFQLT